MAKSVTVTFSDGTKVVYQNVPDSVTPEQVEAQANRDYPDLQVTELAGGDAMLTEMRDAIASRTATMQDLRQIASNYGRKIPDEAAAQKWLDFAKDYPDFEIPQDVVTPPVGRAEAFGTGFMRGVQNVADVITGFGAWLADKFDISPADAVGWAAENLSGYSPEEANRIAKNLSGLGSFQEIVQAGSEARAAAPSVVAAQKQRGPTFTAGLITGEVAATAPAISAGGAGLARLGTAGVAATEAGTLARAGARGVQQFGRAVQTGGTGVRAVTPQAVVRGAPVAGTRTGRMALRVGGGTTAGVAGGALTDQDLLTSAVAGGGIPIVGTIGRQGAGTVYDALRGRLGEVRAAEIMRNVISENATAIAQALREAPANIRANTAQFLAEFSPELLTPELASATNIAVRAAENRPLLNVAMQRNAAREQLLGELRGGATQTEAVENINAMRRGVQQTAEPLRQKAMSEINVGRTQIAPLERLATVLDAAARRLNEAGQVRRMRGLEGRTVEQMENVFAHPELYSPSTSGRMLTRLGEVADQAGRRADEGIDLQLFLRDEAAMARGVADDLRARGYAPLDIRPVVSRMRELAAAALPNTGRRMLFSRFADTLEQAAAENGGIITGEQLHLAKRELGDFVASVLGQADPSAIQRGTSMMAGDVQSAIDDAFNAAAPGSPMAEYNRIFSEGMRRVERQEFGRRLTKLPARLFDRVMAGNDPDLVSRLFPGEFDINAILSPAQQQTARQLHRMTAADLDVSATALRALPSYERGPLGTGVRRGVQQALEPGMGMFGRGVFRVTGVMPGAAAARATSGGLEEAIANRMAASTMRRLAPALASPQEAARLLGVQSTADRVAAVINRMSPKARMATIQTGQQIMQGPPDIPPDFPTIVGYSINPDGTVTPQYGYPVSNAMAPAGDR